MWLRYSLPLSLTTPSFSWFLFVITASSRCEGERGELECVYAQNTLLNVTLKYIRSPSQVVQKIKRHIRALLHPMGNRPHPCSLFCSIPYLLLLSFDHIYGLIFFFFFLNRYLWVTGHTTAEFFRLVLENLRMCSLQSLSVPTGWWRAQQSVKAWGAFSFSSFICEGYLWKALVATYKYIPSRVISYRSRLGSGTSLGNLFKGPAPGESEFLAG